MATYIPAATAMDPLGSALGGAVGAFGAGMLARHFTQKDMQAFDKWLKENQAAQNPMSYAAMGPHAMNFGPQMAQPTPFPTMRSPEGRQMAVDYRQGQLASLMPPGPMDQARTESLRAEAERDRAYADQLRNPTPELDPYSVPHLVRNLGFAPKEAIEARNIHYGLSPRASSAKPETALDRLNTLSNLYQKTLDPAWGERMPELHGLGDIVLTEIGTLTDQLKESGVPLSVIEKAKEPQEVQPPKAVAPANRAQIARDLTKLHETEQFSVPVMKIVGQYPKLAEKMPKMTPAERAEIISAIQGGMSEAEILQYVR